MDCSPLQGTPQEIPHGDSPGISPGDSPGDSPNENLDFPNLVFKELILKLC